MIMRATLKLVSCCILALVISFGLFSHSASAGLFTKSCQSTSLSDSTLSSSCNDGNGGIKRSSINLNPLIGNDDRVLKWGRQNFDSTCEEIRLEGAGALFANCKRKDGSLANTSVNLDDRISNIFGTLKFDG